MNPIPVIRVQLVHILGPMKGEIQEFREGTILIGRDPSCQLKFPADLAVVSRKHALITREGNQFKLVDSSSNGTFVNGKKITESPLRNGDVLEFSEGGPKVSFLSEIMEDEEETVDVPPPVLAQEQQPASPVQPVQEPVIAPVQQEIPKPVQPQPAQPVQQPSAGVSVQKVSAPLVVQYGPTLRSYRELPVTIGRNPNCDFALEHPSIIDQHLQIFFSQNQYWVKDLTGQQALRINGQPVNMQSPLNVNDELSLSLQGPVFRFLGEGRLAEVEQAPVEEPQPSRDDEQAKSPESQEGKRSNKLLSKFKKMF